MLKFSTRKEALKEKEKCAAPVLKVVEPIPMTNAIPHDYTGAPIREGPLSASVWWQLLLCHRAC